MKIIGARKKDGVFQYRVLEIDDDAWTLRDFDFQKNPDRELVERYGLKYKENTDGPNTPLFTEAQLVDCHQQEIARIISDQAASVAVSMPDLAGKILK